MEGSENGSADRGGGGEALDSGPRGSTVSTGCIDSFEDVVVSGSTGQARDVVSQSDRTLAAQVGVAIPISSRGAGIVVSPVYGDGGVSTTGVGDRTLEFGPVHDQVPGCFHGKQRSGYRNGDGQNLGGGLRGRSGLSGQSDGVGSTCQGRTGDRAGSQVASQTGR